MERLKSLVEEKFDPLLCHVKNGTQTSDFAIDADDGLDRRQLERQIIGELLERDTRFRGQSAEWTNLALNLKELALTAADPDTILEELSAQMTRLAALPGTPP
jgi:hypothetical protein